MTYKQAWEINRLNMEEVFREPPLFKIGRIETNSAGKSTFIEMSCPYCRISTGGQHEMQCPHHPRDAYGQPTFNLKNAVNL